MAGRMWYYCFALCLLACLQQVGAGKLDDEEELAAIMRNSTGKTNKQLAGLLYHHLSNKYPGRKFVTVVYNADKHAGQERVSNGLWDVLGEKYKKALAFQVGPSFRLKPERVIRQEMEDFCKQETTTGGLDSQIHRCRRKDVQRCSHYTASVVHDQLRKLVPVTMSLAVITRGFDLAIRAHRESDLIEITYGGVDCNQGTRRGVFRYQSSGLHILAVPRSLL